MNKPVTIVITPRDRYSELYQCVLDLYEYTDPALFDLLILDLGYPKKHLQLALTALQGKSNYELVGCGRIIPMEAMNKVRPLLMNPLTVFMDNDSRATSGWLEPLIETAQSTGAAVVSPVVLERAGVDKGAELRNHLFTTELRVVDVENTPYLIEHKTYRRALPDSLPAQTTETQAFELHCVMFNTEILQSLELPLMTIREHLDIGMQLRSRNLKLLVEPGSKIIFDNLGTRANLSDLKYFNLRWNSKITKKSSDLFQQRWGYRFYSEESIYNWAIRRRLFLLLRWMYLPIGIANSIDRLFFAVRRRVAPIWDPLDDPIAKSRMLYEQFPDNVPRQLDHATN